MTARWFVAAGIAGFACAGGYLCWSYVAKNNLRMEALTKQIRSAEEAEQKARAEAEAAQRAKELAAAEEAKRIADAKVAAVAEAKSKIAAERIASVAMTDTRVPVAEKKPAPVLVPSPLAENHEREETDKLAISTEVCLKMPTEKDIEGKREAFGPIPNVKYA